MNGTPGHERDPDQAALDELVRAFAGDDSDPVPADVVDPSGGGPTQAADPPTSAPADGDLIDDLDGAPAAPAWAIDDDPERPGATPAEEILIVEAEPTERTPPPRIIRIDDYGGSVLIDDAPDDSGSAPSLDGAGEEQSPDRDLDASGGNGGDDGAPIVIAIEDEDLPDAVYIEGSLDGSSSRSIVFIQDDDTGDALAPESERDIRRGIEPRMRERRVAVKRAQGRKRLKWVVLVVTIVAVVVGTLAVLGSGLFAIREDQVTLTGNVYTDPERLREVIDELVGTPVLVADTQAAERQLEEIPWVETARVRTDFPHGVDIEIRERRAIATYQGPDQRFRVLDRFGRVLDVIDNYPFAYVLLGGPDPVDLEAGEFAPYGYAAASDLAKNLTGSIRTRVSLIEVTADGASLVVHVDDGLQVRFGEARDLLIKLVRLEAVLSAGGVPDVGVIDVSTNQVTL